MIYFLLVRYIYGAQQITPFRVHSRVNPLQHNFTNGFQTRAISRFALRQLCAREIDTNI